MGGIWIQKFNAEGRVYDLTVMLRSHLAVTAPEEHRAPRPEDWSPWRRVLGLPARTRDTQRPWRLAAPRRAKRS